MSYADRWIQLSGSDEVYGGYMASDYAITHCSHGTFIGYPGGPDYLCHYCEMGITVNTLWRSMRADSFQDKNIIKQAIKQRKQFRRLARKFAKNPGGKNARFWDVYERLNNLTTKTNSVWASKWIERMVAKELVCAINRTRKN